MKADSSIIDARTKRDTTWIDILERKQQVDNLKPTSSSYDEVVKGNLDSKAMSSILQNKQSASLKNAPVASTFGLLAEMQKVAALLKAPVRPQQKRVADPSMKLQDDVELMRDEETQLSEVKVDEKYWDKEVEGNNVKKTPNVIDSLNKLGGKVKMGNVVKNYNDLFVRSKILERIIPRHIETAAEFEMFNKYVCKESKDFEESDLSAVNEGILEPIYDLIDRGGKRWRPVLGMIYAECLGRNVAESIEKGEVENDDVLFACGLTEFVHNGSLMVDDVEDKSLMRRGQPCTYIKYGEDYAVNTGTIMYCVPIMKIDEFIRDDDALKFMMYKTCCEETANLHFGQNWDIHWHNGARMPTEAQYLQMIINKTSVLPRLCVRLIAAIMKVDATDMINYVEQLGAAFQIQDDLIAIKSEAYAKERGILAEDIHEGKRTLMVSYAYYKSDTISEDDKKRLLEILDMKTEDETLLREAIDILKRSGSIEYAEERAKTMLAEAWAKVDKTLPDNEGKAKLKQLSDFLIDREL